MAYRLCTGALGLTAGTRIAFVGVNGDVSHYTIKATKAIKENDILVGLLGSTGTPWKNFC